MDTPPAVRHRLVDALCQNGSVSTTAVESAMRTVPRELFLPEVSLEEAYLDQPIVTKRDAAGTPISSASQPAIVAIMLEQLDVQPGHRILEIGAGTGYNAALLDQLVGDEGMVTTVDIDDDLMERARHALDTVGATNVRTVCRDGGHGYAEGAPYDRIIVTVGAWDLPRAWFDQLRLGGLLVVPLGMRGVQRSIAFERRADRWHGLSAIDCGFMSMRGAFADPTAPVRLGETIEIYPAVEVTPDPVGRVDINVDSNSNGVDRPAIDENALLETFRPDLDSADLDSAVASAVHGTSREFLGSANLWLALSEESYCRLTATGPDEHLLPALFVWDGTTTAAGLVEGGSAALLSGPGGSELPRDGDPVELGVRPYGPNGTTLADRLLAALRRWDLLGRPRTASLQVDAFPVPPGDRTDPDVDRPAFVLDKPEARLVVHWG